MSEASLGVLQCMRRCNFSVSKNAPSYKKTRCGDALVSFAGGPPIPHIVRVGENCEDAVFKCGIQPKKGYAEEELPSEHRIYFMLVKLCILCSVLCVKEERERTVF